MCDLDGKQPCLPALITGHSLNLQIWRELRETEGVISCVEASNRSFPPGHCCTHQGWVEGLSLLLVGSYSKTFLDYSPDLDSHSRGERVLEVVFCQG